MAHEHQRLTRTLSRFELGAAVILVSIFVGYFLHRIIILTIAAEARHLELAIGNLRAGLMVYSAAQLIHGKYEEMHAITLTNPLGVATEYPRNYFGETGAADSGQAGPGQWYFDTENRQLVYQVVNADAFHNLTTGLPRVRMSLRLNYEDRDADGQFTSGTDLPRSISLQVLDEYEWAY